ncbi:MAG: type II CRISPR-associated endonuclease Cas1 [Candidatus Aenigmatarchaeota archaeon]
MWGWRVILINSESNLKLLHGNLHIIRADGQISFPIEDIDMVLVEAPFGVVTFPLLRKLAEKGIPLLITDNTFLPSGIFLPYFSQQSVPNLLFQQLELKIPFKKRVWQRIVQQKILNQAKTLDLLGKESKSLLEIALNVRSGDSTNREAVAAKVYFKSLLESSSRKADSLINSALNYGYSIVRSAVARSLAASGLVCALGLGHKSRTNPFNLADDFVEVFRPFVDLMIFKEPPCEELSPNYKKYLIKVLKMECAILGKIYSISTACWEIAHSYAKAVLKEDHRLVNLPSLFDFSFRDYE